MDFHFSADLLKTLRKAPKRRHESVLKKTQEICEHPPNYKPLSGKLHGYRRVHIDGSYVLIFHYVEASVYFDRLEHHDDVYRGR